ncbi:hypothetical protein P43SY_009348 [Pythium insidiosum]|uniref:Uncharacterized protein n=1 Tax=Pythium insidiosum TaxID=114742 RepID=A0AAD5QBY8_PYTIN|nr:hypothetical protein P43SY_009348 [Pythium insidiosum]
MGSSESTARRLRETPLVPQTQFPKAINARFVDHQRQVTLRLPHRFWSHTEAEAIDIQDADTGKTLFKVSPATDKGPFRHLLDANGVFVATLEAYTVDPKLVLYVPTTSLMLPSLVQQSGLLNSKELCYIETNALPLETPLRVGLDNPARRVTSTLTVDGAWRKRLAFVSIRHGVQGYKEYIARVRSETDEHGKASQDAPTFLLDVAPGVDMALLLLITAAMEEETHKQEGDWVVGTDEKTLSMASHHSSHARSMSKRQTMGEAAAVTLRLGADGQLPCMNVNPF